MYEKRFRIPMPRETSRAQAASVILFLVLLCHFSFNAMDHVPSNILREFTPSQTLHLRGPRSSHSYDQKKGRSPNLRHVSRTHLVDLGQLLPRINVDGSIAIRHVRTTEQWADILTKGAFTTTQWTFLMQLFDFRPPPKWNVDRWFSKSSCSPRIPHATSGVHNTQRDFEHGSEKEKLEDSSAGVEENSAWSNPLLRTGCSSLGFAKKLYLTKPMRFPGRKAA